MGDNYDYDRTKHLDMIQAAVARMAGNSFTVKGWSVAATSALLGFAVETRSVPLTLVALVPAVIFWGLDAYFLSLEKKYRSLFDKVRLAEATDFGAAGAGALSRYALDPSLGEGPGTLATALGSPSVRTLHVALIATVVAAALLIGRAPEQRAEPTEVRLVR